MKILMILSNGFDPDIRVYKEAKFLVDNGYEVTVIAWDRDGSYDNFKEKFNGINIIRFSSHCKYGTGYKQFLCYLKFITFTLKFIKNTKFNYLHFHDLDTALISMLLFKKNKNIVFDMHEYYIAQKSNKFKLFIINYLLKRIYNKTDKIIYVNPIQLEYMKPEIKRKCIFLPNYAEKNIFENLSKSEYKKLRINYIGAVRQFEQLKNLILAADGFNIEINIYGSGVDCSKIEEFAKKYKYVKVYGKFSYFDSSEIYANTDISYIMYRSDSKQNNLAFPVKFYEAILSKTPIIVSNDSILSNYVNEYNIGFSCNGDNVDDIKKLFVEIENNKKIIQEKINNYNKININEYWENIAGNLFDIYKGGCHETNKK